MWGSFFNQAAWSSLHLQWAIAHNKLAGKSSVALRETVVLEEYTYPASQKRERGSQLFPKAYYILTFSLPKGYEWCFYWLLCKERFLSGTDASHLTKVTATTYPRDRIKYFSSAPAELLHPGMTWTGRAHTHTLAIVVSTGHRGRTKKGDSFQKACFGPSTFRAWVKGMNRHKTCLNSVTNRAAWLLKQNVTLEHLLSFLWWGPVVKLPQFASFGFCWFLGRRGWGEVFGGGATDFL